MTRREGKKEEANDLIEIQTAYFAEYLAREHARERKQKEMEQRWLEKQWNRLFKDQELVVTSRKISGSASE